MYKCQRAHNHHTLHSLVYLNAVFNKLSLSFQLALNLIRTTFSMALVEPTHIYHFVDGKCIRLSKFTVHKKQ